MAALSYIIVFQVQQIIIMANLANYLILQIPLQV
jgi:hypothetical protein